jgi:hypothetical protein
VPAWKEVVAAVRKDVPQRLSKADQAGVRRMLAAVQPADDPQKQWVAAPPPF